MIHPHRIEVVKSFRGSRLRLRVLRALAKLGEAYPAELARKCRVQAKVVHWILHGHPPRYRRDRSLVTLGLVTVKPTRDGDMYVITPAGFAASKERV